MPNADDMTLDDMSLMLKGPFGFGKTDAIGSFALGGDIWIAYFDKNKPIELKHYFNNIIHRPELLRRVNYDVYSAKNAHEYINKLIDLSKYNPYFAIGTDSITMLTAAAVGWSMAWRNNKTGPKKDEQNSQALQFIPDWDEYKVETGMVSQALDICRSMKCYNIWTAHPIPSTKIETDSQKKISITKTTSIVSYGSKVAGLAPGQFQEIYHFGKDHTWDGNAGRTIDQFIVHTANIGDDFAKTALNLPRQFDITNRPFYEVWSDLVKEGNVKKEDPIESSSF